MCGRRYVVRMFMDVFFAGAKVGQKCGIRNNFNVQKNTLKISLDTV